MKEEHKPLAADFLAEMERCCRSGCVNCPYVPRHRGGAEIDWVFVEFFKANPESTYDDYLEFREEIASG